MAKVRRFDDYVIINCPGCETTHVIGWPNPLTNKALWSFNENYDKPTFHPSLLVTTGKYVKGYENCVRDTKDQETKDFLERTSSVCHSFIKDGMIQFLSDCTHHLKSQTVELLDVRDPLS